MGVGNGVRVVWPVRTLLSRAHLQSSLSLGRQSLAMQQAEQVRMEEKWRQSMALLHEEVWNCTIQRMPPHLYRKRASPPSPRRPFPLVTWNALGL